MNHYVDPMELHGSKKPRSFIENWDPTLSESWLTLFLRLFPAQWLKLVLVAETNKKHKEMTWYFIYTVSFGQFPENGQRQIAYINNF